MPVARGGPPPARQAIMIGLGLLCGVVAVIFLTTRLDNLTDSDGSEIEVGDPVFDVGAAAELAPTIAERGPLLLPDLARGDKDIWLNHLGDDPEEGWVAFSVRPLEAPRTCATEWRADDRTFVDACDGTIYPESGEGLQNFPVSVDPDGDLNINLNAVAADDG